MKKLMTDLGEGMSLTASVSVDIPAVNGKRMEFKPEHCKLELSLEVDMFVADLERRVAVKISAEEARLLLAMRDARTPDR